ncbi:hypothetical protein [Kushneria sp. TE3]|uniref:hypothetical protein n=1 Tax=Kushneria sp. TE3 TaxID=3449832 RepID=UPI003F688E1E
MNLLKQTGRHLQWFSSVWRRLLSQTPVAAPATSLLLLTSQLAQMVAFLLPLKVILLLGGNGIPRYFRGFVTPETRDLWIVLLCIGAIALYGLSQLMDWLAEKQSRRGSRIVLDNARKIALFSDQGEGVSEHYRRVCGVVADGATVIVGMGAGLFLFPTLFGFLLVIMMLMYVATAAVIGLPNEATADKIERWIASNSGGFLRTLGSIGFLSGFLCLVAEFYRLDNLNLLIGIISLILSRRLFQSATGFVSGQLRLAEKRERVDALFFREKQLLATESRDGQRFWQLFTPEVRVLRSAGWLSHALNQQALNLQSYWRDSGQGGVILFDLFFDKEEKSHRVLEKIYFPKQQAQAGHEAYLLSRMDTQALNAPRLIDNHVFETFACVHLAHPGGAPIARKHWRNVHSELILKSWCYVPSEEIVDVYLRSQPPLWSRAGSRMFERLHLAIDGDKQRRLLAVFLEHLEEMQERLRRLPLFIHNPEMNDRNVLLDDTGQPCIIAWGKWELEPIGVGATADQLRAARKGELLAQLKTYRRVDESCQDRDLLLACGMHELERIIGRQQYQRALQHMAQIMKEAFPDKSESAGNVIEKGHPA